VLGGVIESSRYCLFTLDDLSGDRSDIQKLLLAQQCQLKEAVVEPVHMHFATDMLADSQWNFWQSSERRFCIGNNNKNFYWTDLLLAGPD